MDGTNCSIINGKAHSFVVTAKIRAAVIGLGPSRIEVMKITERKECTSNDKVMERTNFTTKSGEVFSFAPMIQKMAIVGRGFIRIDRMKGVGELGGESKSKLMVTLK